MRRKRILSEETKKKIGDSLRGKKRVFSEEAIKNMQIAAAKRRGIKRGPPSEDTKKKISEATTGVKKTITSPNKSWFPIGNVPKKSFEKGGVPWNKGRRTPPEVVEKTAAKLRGKKRSPEQKEEQRQRSLKFWAKKDKSKKYGSRAHRKWCEDIVERDGNRCTKCGSLEGLCAHHIIGWNEDETLRLELDNGITLCRSCHAKEHKINLYKKGSKLSEEHREKLSGPRPHVIPWNLGNIKEIPKTRVCKKCKIEKKITDFTPQSGRYTYICKKCRNNSLRNNNDTKFME